jgi:hypothetical protein
MPTKSSKKTASKATSKKPAAKSSLKSLTLPSSKVKIQFSPNFDKKKLADLTRELCMNEKLAAEMRANPTKSLAEVGIIINDKDRRKVNDEDILAAMGHRPAAIGKVGTTFLGPLVVVLVIVGVINVPEPAY